MNPKQELLSPLGKHYSQRTSSHSPNASELISEFPKMGDPNMVP